MYRFQQSECLRSLVDWQIVWSVMQHPILSWWLMGLTEVSALNAFVIAFWHLLWLKLENIWTFPNAKSDSLDCVVHFQKQRLVTILGFLSTDATTTIWTLEGPGRWKIVVGGGAGTGLKGEGGEGQFETFLRSLLPSAVGVYASGNELQRGRAADWLESDWCLCWPERLMLQPLLLWVSNTQASATLTCTYFSSHWH